MRFGFGRKKDAEAKPAREAPGWDAIDRRLVEAYPDQEPAHWGTDQLPGEGVYGLSAYREPDAWCFVTYGLTELFAKESDDPITSGFGFEMTMRVAPMTPDPPAWARELVYKLAMNVFHVGRGLEPGQRLDLRQPITGGKPPTNLTALAVVEDPVLGPIDGPNGQAVFLTLVGITASELEEMKASSTNARIDLVRPQNPRLVTNINA